jgi:hypothetical protein
LRNHSADESAETRAEFVNESSIHIYSLEPGPVAVCTTRVERGCAANEART